jgi:hypothetical protein
MAVLFICSVLGTTTSTTLQFGTGHSLDEQFGSGFLGFTLGCVGAIIHGIKLD